MIAGRSGGRGAAAAGGGAASRTATAASRGGTGTGAGGATIEQALLDGGSGHSYLTVQGTPSGNFSVPIGDLVHAVHGDGWVPKFNTFGNPLRAPWFTGVVVEQAMQPGLNTPVAIQGVVRVKATGTIGVSEWVRAGSAGAVESLRKGYLDWPQAPPGAIGYSLSAAADGHVILFLGGRAFGVQAGDFLHQAWQLRADFEGAAALVDSAGSGRILNAGPGGDWRYLSNSGTPLSHDYLGRSSSVRIVPDSTAVGPLLHLLAPGSAGTFGTLFNPGGGLFSEVWHVEARWAQAGVAAQTRRIGLSSVAMNTAGEPANGVYFRHTNGGNIIAVSRRAGVEVTLDTGVAAGADYHTAAIWVHGPGGVMFVSVDDVIFAETLLGFQDLDAPNVQIGPCAAGSNTTAGQGLDVDYILVHGNRNPLL